MTEAYAIKGPDGKIDFVEIDADLEEVWYEYIKAVEGKIPTSGSIVKDIQYWKDEGYTCVPVTVTVSEKGEQSADELLREAMAVLSMLPYPTKICARINAYLSHKEQKT